MADLTNTGYGGVQLKWIGAAGATMMSVNGPLVGWGIRNICLSGNSLAYTGLKVISAQGGEVVNFAVKGLSNSGTVSGRCIWEFTVPAFGGHLTNTMHNSWRNIFLAIPATTTFQSNGWVFDAADSSANTCYESVQNLSIVLGAPSSGCQVKGITFGGCDNIRIRDLHVALVSGGAGQAYPLLLNYSNAGSAGWPADCLIDGVDFGNGFTAVASSFGAPSGATPNRIVAISSTNGSISDPALTNLHWGYTASNP